MVSVINWKHPVLVRRCPTSIEVNQFFNILAVSVRNDETMHRDLALYFCGPVTNVLEVSHRKQLTI